MSRYGCLLALGVAAGVQTLHGQDVSRLQARADSLAREWRRANALADMVDSLERVRAASGTDTISIGALRIVTDPSPLRLREAAARAWPLIDSLYGSEAQQLAQRPYFIAPYDPDTAVPQPLHRGSIQVPWDKDVASLTMILLTNIPLAPPDTVLRNWLGGAVRPSILPAQQRERIYVQLVAAPSQTARSCFLGVMEGCRSALGLADSAAVVPNGCRATRSGHAVLRRVLRVLRSRGAKPRAAGVWSGERYGVHPVAAIASPGCPATPVGVRRA
jgi:hypothetical protein